jgi:hypothetical protein
MRFTLFSRRLGLDLKKKVVVLMVEFFLTGDDD